MLKYSSSGGKIISQQKKFDVAVIGAGIAGIAACHALIRTGTTRIALIDCGSPLSLTSDKSTECFRNFWPGPDSAMAEMMNDSIAHLQNLTEKSGDRFQMRQHGYLFATANQQEIELLKEQAHLNEQYGGGALRIHDQSHSNATHPIRYQQSPNDGIDRTLTGADLITNHELIRQNFPYLADNTNGVLHVRNCGSVSAQQLGMYLLEESRDSGVELINGNFTGIQTSAGQLSGVELQTTAGSVEVQTNALVLATGPNLKSSAKIAGTNLPVLVEPHVKITMADKLGVIPRDAPLIIWNDPVDLPWTEEERQLLMSSPETRHLTNTFPAGVHGRPVGSGDQIFIYWTFNNNGLESPVFPIEHEPHFPEILLRGMARMIPGLTTYFDRMPKPYIDGGYYTKTSDNRPLIGPMDIPGTFVCGAYSGYGIMASCAGGDLLAAHVTGQPMPGYAKAFDAKRFSDEAYVDKIAGLATAGQI